MEGLDEVGVAGEAVKGGWLVVAQAGDKFIFQHLDVGEALPGELPTEVLPHLLSWVELGTARGLKEQPDVRLVCGSSTALHAGLRCLSLHPARPNRLSSPAWRAGTSTTAGRSKSTGVGTSVSYVFTGIFGTGFRGIPPLVTAAG